MPSPFLTTWSAQTVQVERVSFVDEMLAIALVRAHDDKTYSLCDAQSFVVMERLTITITEAIAADEDFRQYGFQTLLQCS